MARNTSNLDAKPDLPAGLSAGLPTALRWVALFGLLVGGLLPASAGVELFPYWDLDPSVQWVPSTGIRPAQMLLLALLSVVSAGLAILADIVSNRRVSPVPAMLAGIGTIGVLAHGLFDDALHGTMTDGSYEGAQDGIEHLVRAAPWVAMLWSWVGVSRLCRCARTKPIVLAVVAGFMVMLLAKGLLQVFIEHPATIADFERTKDAVLASNGWATGSPGALAYERRLMQPEASGWFGLSNVYATFVGGGAAGLIAAGAAIGVRERRFTRGVVLCSAVAVCALIALLLSKSKGGIGAAGIGLGACGCIALVGRLGRPGLVRAATRWAGPAVIAGVLGLIAVRGMLGPEMGERSLLFRAFYAVGSLRIWGDHPLFGVGPDGFQDAYAAAKIPIATETVQSPHSVLLDWTATLGVFGLAWAALLVWQSTRLFLTDEAAAIPHDEKPRGLDRGTVRFIVLVIAAVGLAATGFERALATPSFALARVVGLGAWLAAALGLVTVFRDRAAPRWFGFASGIAIVAHIQIEVTPVWVNAGPLLGVWLGAVTGWPPADRAHDAPARRPLSARIVPLLAVCIGIVTIGLALPATVRWQAALGRAAETVRPAADLRQQYERYAAANDRAGMRSLLDTIRGTGVSGMRRDSEEAIESVRLAWLEVARDDLTTAVNARPGHADTRKAAGRITLQLFASRATPDSPELDRISNSAVSAVVSRPRSVSLMDWSASSEESAARLLLSNGHASIALGWLRSAAMTWGFLDEQTPHATRPAIHLMDLSLELASMEYPEKWNSEAIRWAREALRRDDLTALDPIAGLSDAERARAEALVAGADQPED